MRRRATTCLITVIVAAGCGGSLPYGEPEILEVPGTTVAVAVSTLSVSVPVSTLSVSVPVSTLSVSVPVPTIEPSAISTLVTTDTWLETTPTEIPPASTTATASSSTLTPNSTTTPESVFSFSADESGDYFEIEFGYDGYLCRDTWEWEQYECVGYTGGLAPSFLFPDLYCSGARDRPDCSEYESGDYFEIEFGYDGYLCRDTWEWEQYECVGYTGGLAPSFLFPDLYCSGARDRPDCSEYESGDYFEIEFGYDGYLCRDTWEWEQYECVGYTGGLAPSFLFPDLYCSGARDRPDCSEYESGDYFEIEFGYDGYLCRDTWEWEQYECVGYTGGLAPSFLFPDLYCSGARDRPDCSEYWYLKELNRYDLRTIDGSTFLCQEASSGDWDDYDCSRYSGGDPAWVSFYRPDLRCTQRSTTLECDSNDYPSEWDDNWEDECWEDEWEDEWEEECW